jgi:hypothetical protein
VGFRASVDMRLCGSQSQLPQFFKFSNSRSLQLFIVYLGTSKHECQQSNSPPPSLIGIARLRILGGRDCRYAVSTMENFRHLLVQAA